MFASVDPNIAFLCLVAGILAIYWELHAPGMVAPGVLGACLFLAGAWSLSHDNPTWYGTLLVVSALFLLAIEIKVHTHMLSGMAGTIAFGIGALLLVRDPHPIAPWVALPLSFAFGAITIFLGTLAMRAHHNKRVAGMETMVGEIGTARTDIDPAGTVLVRGEYWQARSNKPVLKGGRVYVVAVRGMELLVAELAGAAEA